MVIVDTKYNLFYPQPEANADQGIPAKVLKEMATISDSIELIGYDIRELRDEIGIYQAALKIITANGAVRGTGKVNDSIQLLKETVAYYTEKMNEINRKLLALDKKLNVKNKIQQRLQTRYNDLQNYQNQNYNTKKYEPIPRVVVTLSATEAATGKITFSYLVATAGWTPLYDIRSDSQTGKISLTYKAQVYQNSGMDWENVKLNISTNNPFVNKTKPELNPWYIDYYAYKGREQLNEVEIVGGRKTKNIPQAAFNQGFILDKKTVEDVPAMDADQFTTVVQQLTAAEVLRRSKIRSRSIFGRAND
ncbi:MAG: mucoidy inhibitor MuiA family protein [Flavobacteriia bacterium]|nr:mucoidy inhibitor MuiA family protein [Flavobacteriia bacterium]